MFDLNATDGSVRTKKRKHPLDADADPAPRRANTSEPLDSEEAVRLHRQLLAYYHHELDRQADNRALMARDEAFYDGQQWNPDDAAVLEERGQKPTVYNVTAATVDWVLGTERRTRADHKVLPRRKEDGKNAQRKSELMKYLNDVNKTPFEISQAFAETVKAGLGWIMDGVEDDTDGEPLFTNFRSWRNVLHDSAAKKLGFEDGRYIFDSQWVDEDLIKSIFKTRHAVIDAALSDTNAYSSMSPDGDEAMDAQEHGEGISVDAPRDLDEGFRRRRVRVITAWITLPESVDVLRGGTFAGEIYRKGDAGHDWSVTAENVDLVPRPRRRMYVVIFTTAGLLWKSVSPYRHNRFPLTPVWGKRNAETNLPYGMIRNLVSLQEDINQNASKARYILATNKVVMDDDALADDTDIEDFRTEVARPDAIIIKKRGSTLDLKNDRELGQWHIEAMSRNIAMVQQASGVTDELLGRSTNARSGIAIARRQDQGSATTIIWFDNLRLASQLRGEKQLSNIEQFITEQKAFRITNQRNQPEFITVNDGLPENDIVRSKADFIISDEDWHATLRQAAVESLLEVASKFPPDVVMLLLDLIVENMDLANRDELVKRIRAVNGQRDPDATEPTPEEQAKAQEQAELAQLNKVAALADVRRKVAEAGKTEAEAEAAGQKAVRERIDMQARALDVAGLALGLPPAAAHTADHILDEAGYRPASPNPDAPGLGPAAPDQSPWQP